MASDDDYLSELTELESEYGETNNKKAPTKTGWRVRKALTPPRATTYSAQALYDQIHAGDINLEPEYQRDVVWPESKQIMIIDSIFRNFYIPPVIFAVKVHDDGSETKTCIDGKQRLTSIYRFMDGIIPHKDPVSGEKLWFNEDTAARGSKRKLMPERYRKVFANKQVVCVEYHQISEEDEREVFQRVQLGMALTPAEKLQVINTPRAVFVREVLSTYLREDGTLGPDALNWSPTRSSDFRCLGHAIHIMDNSTPSKCISSDFAQVEKWLRAKGAVEKSVKKNVMQSFQIFADLVADSKHGKIFKKYKKVSPVEFVYTSVFIYLHKGEHSMTQLGGGLSDMFDHVRKIHRDVRMNNRVQKTFTSFISGWSSKKGIDEADEDEGGTTTKKRKRTTKAATKKIADGDMDVDDDDDDYQDQEPKGPKAKKKSSGTSKTATSALEPPRETHIKTETDSSVLGPANSMRMPERDRLAAIRKTKEAISQSQTTRPTESSASRAPFSRPETANAASTISANPQMLPSPSQHFLSPSEISQFLASQPISNLTPNGLLHHHPPPESGSSTSSSAETSLWKSTQVPNPNLGISIPNDVYRPLPPPPLSAGSSSSLGHREKDRDREREKDRDWDRRGGGGDRESHRRYDHHRRDSGSGGGGYRPRSQDDRDWSSSGRRW